jgi:hypothetical protein
VPTPNSAARAAWRSNASRWSFGRCAIRTRIAAPSAGVTAHPTAHASSGLPQPFCTRLAGRGLAPRLDASRNPGGGGPSPHDVLLAGLDDSVEASSGASEQPTAAPWVPDRLLLASAVARPHAPFQSRTLSTCLRSTSSHAPPPETVSVRRVERSNMRKRVVSPK